MKEADSDSGAYTPVSSNSVRSETGKTPTSGKNLNINKNSSSSIVSGRKKRKTDDEEARRLIAEEEERREAELQAKKQNSVIIRIPNGPLMRVDKKKAEELSEENGKDLVQLAQKTSKAKTSPKKSIVKPKSAKKNK